MGKEKKEERTEGQASGHPQCKPIDMQDKAGKATQEGQDQAVKFGPGVSSRKVPDEGAQHIPGITRTKSE